MSASDAFTVFEGPGQYLDGRVATAHPVTAQVAHGQLHLRGEAITAGFALAQVRISPRLGRLPRTLTLPDGASVVIDDSALLAQALGEAGPSLHGMESRAGYALLAVAVLSVTLTLLYFFGIPIAADHIARGLTPAMEKKLSSSTLEGVDASGLFKPSALSPERQTQIRETLQPLLHTAGLPTVQLAFRSGEKDMGANAFALMGADIVLTDALVELLNPDEVRAVVAHELGHVHHHHVARLTVRHIGVTGLWALLTGMGNVGSQMAHSLGMANYSRAFESEADAFADQLLQTAGASPCALASALAKLEKQAASHADGVTQWFASHPRSEERIAAIQQRCGTPKNSSPR